jgi:uncharacterized protein (TIGR00255 family)
MTGLGQASGSNARRRITVTLRSVNHRYLDLALRLRDEQRAAEEPLRQLLEGALRRGRVEVSVEEQPVGSAPVRAEVRLELARAVCEASELLRREGLTEGTLRPGDLFRIPEVVVLRSDAEAWDDADTELLLTVAGEALAQLVQARQREGARLTRVLLERIDSLQRVVEALSRARLGARRGAVDGLRQRLEELLGDHELDEGRMLQEVAILADRMDTSEELDRLMAHVDHFRVVAARDEAAGRRLDFLAQEMFRELNTVGAKCRDAEMTRLVLDAKMLCEQVREQVQNVE